MPPPSPGVATHKVTTEFVLSGAVADYDEQVKMSIKAVLAANAGVSTSAVTLTISAGSVVVSSDIFFATETGASVGASALSRGVLADAASLETAISDQLAADGLGDDDISITVAAISTPPQAVVEVAATPPSSPPPIAPTRAGSGSGAGGIIGAVVVILIIAACVLVICRKYKETGSFIIKTGKPTFQPEVTELSTTPVLGLLAGASGSAPKKQEQAGQASENEYLV